MTLLKMKEQNTENINDRTGEAMYLACLRDKPDERIANGQYF